MYGVGSIQSSLLILTRAIMCFVFIVPGTIAYFCLDIFMPPLSKL